MSDFSTETSVTGHWTGEFDDHELQVWATQLRERLGAPRVSLGLVFMAPRFFSHAAQVLEILRVHARVGLLIGCSGTSLIVGREEIEKDAGIVVGLYVLPGANLKATHFTQRGVEEANGPGYWQLETGVEPEATNGWLMFADPFTLDGETLVAQWNEAYPGVPIYGGLASGLLGEQGAQLYLNGDVLEEGGIALSIGGEVALAGVVSQGCVPIGDTWTVTKAEGNLIHEIGNRPAYEVLAKTFNALPRAEQERVQGNLMLGLVANEYQEEFQRGDFLIRNLLGGDPSTGVLAVGARPRTGQSVQFQCRDGAAATEDLLLMLERTRKTLGRRRTFGGCLCSCNGRGEGLFGVPNHDAALIQKQLGPLGLTGFFCNGEIGPVGERNFLHGYTASLALFIQK